VRLLKKNACIKKVKTRDWLSFGRVEVKLLLVPAVFAYRRRGIQQKGDSPAPILPPPMQSLFLSVCDNQKGLFNSSTVPINST